MTHPVGEFNVPVHQLPRYLYFVHHATSRARMISSGGFYAADIWTIPQHLLHLQWLVRQHADWACRIPSCFISTFGDYSHAWNWARQRDAPVTIYQIDTRYTHPEHLIIRASQFSPTCFESEYLFLHAIKGYAIRREFAIASHPSRFVEEQTTEVESVNPTINNPQDTYRVQVLTAFAYCLAQYLQTLRDRR